MIIKKKVTTVQEEEIDIPLPYFAKEKNTFYKVYGEDKCLKVYFHPDGDSSCISDYGSISCVDEAIKSEPSNEAEFNESFTQAMEHFSKNADLWIDVKPLPTPEDFEPKYSILRDDDLITC